MGEVLGAVAGDVWLSVVHNWPYLLASVVIASFVQVYVGPEHLARWLRRRVWVAVLGAVVLASFTPFCSCGTTAVVLGALASSVPWAPVVAFMVSSPLTSPSEYVLSAGLFGSGFATTFFVAAIVIGIGAGAVTHVVEKAGLLVGQARMQGRVEVGAERRAGVSAVAVGVPAADGRTSLAVLEAPAPASACCGPTTAVETGGPEEASASACAAGGCGSDAGGCGTAGVVVDRRRLLVRALADNARRLAVYFLGFAAIGYLLIELVPTDVITSVLGGDSLWSVPLAALLGIPAYVSTEGSLPMVASLMDGGMGVGPALAFLVTGAGTSIGAISGMLVIARARVVALVVGCLVVGAIVLGWLAPLWL